MILVDALIRFTGIGFLFLLAIVALRDLREWRCTPYLFMSCITVAAAFLGLTIDAFKLPQPMHGLVRFLDIPHLVAVWLFALSLFRTDFSLRPFHFVVASFYCLPILIVRLYQFDLIDWRPLVLVYLSNLFSILLMGHLMVTTLRGRRDDLLHTRRKARVYFVMVIAFVTLSAVLTEVVLLKVPAAPRATLWILSIWPAIIWTSFWILSADNNAINFEEGVAPSADLSPRDKDLQSKLAHAMRVDELYKTPDLTIVSLANTLGVTQHRLRALINQSLGYSNFSVFLNSYRIEAVKTALIDPDKVHLPILTIAMDCGFKSLSPFNRAFRASEGITPSQFRQERSKA